MNKNLQLGLGILLVGTGAYLLYKQKGSSEQEKKSFEGILEENPIEIESSGVEATTIPAPESRNGYFTGDCSGGRANVIYRCRKPGTIHGTWCLGSVDLSQFIGANGNYPWGSGCPTSGLVANDMVGVMFTSTVTDQFAEAAID